jgi:aspartate aminotransferase
MNEIPDKAILLDSLSKRYSLCGARLGVFMSLNEDLMKGVTKMAQARLSGGIIDQAVGAKLNEVGDDYIESVQEEYRKRRDFIYEELSKIEGVSLPKPEGAFYSMVTLPVDDAEKFCIWMLSEFEDNNETLMLAPGAGFYATPGKGTNQVRLAYVLNLNDLKRCVEILRKALEDYSVGGKL